MIAPDAPTLTAKDDPTLGVEVFFPTVDGDAETITVWRVADGVTEAVAGALKATVSGAFVVTDWQVPFGVSSSYVGEIFDTSGASVSSLPSSIQVDSDDVWFQNAVDPSESFPVVLRAPSLSPVQRATRNQQVWVAGLRRPFVQNWGEGALTGLPLVTWSESDADAALLNLVTAWPQLVVRTPPSFVTLPRLLYASVERPQHDYPVSVGSDALIVWTFIVDETQPISKAILRPLVTWEDWTAAFPVVLAEWSGTPYFSASTFEGATNLHTSPNPGQNVDGYQALSSGTGNTFTTSVSSSGGILGTGYWRVTASGVNSSNGVARLGPNFVNGSGTVVTIGMWVRASAACDIRCVIREFTNADGTGAETTTAAATVTMVAGEWTFFSQTLTLAGTTNSWRPEFRWPAGSTAAARTFDFDQLSAAIGSSAADFTGDSFTGSSWDDVVSLYAAGTWIDAVRNPPSA